MTARGRREPVHVVLGKRTAYLSGPGVHAALSIAGSPKMWCAKRRTWSCPIDRVSDVLAVVERVHGRRVELAER